MGATEEGRAVPRPEAPRPPGEDATPVEGYRSPRVFSLGATRWLAIQLALSLVILVVDLHEFRLIERRDLDAASTVDDLNVLLSVGLLLAYVITIALFLAWLSRAYRQLPALGVRQPRFGRGWAIGAWFVPILNLARPLQIVNDVWRSGDRDDAIPAWRWAQRPVSTLLAWWWAAWLLASFAGNMAFRMDTDTPDHLQTSLAVDAASQVTSVAAGVLAILVIRRCTARQDARAAQLSGAA